MCPLGLKRGENGAKCLKIANSDAFFACNFEFHHSIFLKLSKNVLTIVLLRLRVLQPLGKIIFVPQGHF